LTDEYMLGPAFLVAPVTDQGVTSREVYLPAGTDWYNYWTNEKMHGGQTVTVDAPIDTLPLFVKAGSILPLGMPVLSTNEAQALENCASTPARMRALPSTRTTARPTTTKRATARSRTCKWDDAAGKLTHDGAQAWTGSDDALLDVVGRK
jgi:alpha-D-xyloside xylohydrolase